MVSLGFAISHTKYLLVACVDQRPENVHHNHMWTHEIPKLTLPTDSNLLVHLY